jgi:hypothetical protein
MYVFFAFLARDEKPPKVIMTNKSYDSVTLSFDHFAPKGYKHGYVAMVRTSVKYYKWNSSRILLLKNILQNYLIIFNANFFL